MCVVVIVDCNAGLNVYENVCMRLKESIRTRRRTRV